MNAQQIEEYFKLLEESLSLAEQQQALNDKVLSEQNRESLLAQRESLEEQISRNLKKMEVLKKK